MSEIDICNMALAKLGQSPITNLLDPETRVEELCKQFYDICRRAAINDADWSFARSRAVLESVQSPNLELFDYNHAHHLPADAMRVIRVYSSLGAGGPAIRWERQGDYILSNYAQIYLIYSRDVTDTTRFSPLFTEALAAKLAFDLAIPITQNASVRDAIGSEYIAKMQQATTLDSLQASAEQTNPSILTGVRGRSATRGGKL